MSYLSAYLVSCLKASLSIKGQWRWKRAHSGAILPASLPAGSGRSYCSGRQTLQDGLQSKCVPACRIPFCVYCRVCLCLQQITRSYSLSSPCPSPSFCSNESALHPSHPVVFMITLCYGATSFSSLHWCVTVFFIVVFIGELGFKLAYMLISFLKAFHTCLLALVSSPLLLTSPTLPPHSHWTPLPLPTLPPPFHLSFVLLS